MEPPVPACLRALGRLHRLRHRPRAFPRRANRAQSGPGARPHRVAPMKSARLPRLFTPRPGRCFDVAIDHGFFNEGSFLAGIENLPRAIATLVAAGPDAIQLTVGQADPKSSPE